MAVLLKICKNCAEFQKSKDSRYGYCNIIMGEIWYKEYCFSFVEKQENTTQTNETEIKE